MIYFCLDTCFVEQTIEILQLLHKILFYFMIIRYLRAQQENVNPTDVENSTLSSSGKFIQDRFPPKKDKFCVLCLSLQMYLTDEMIYFSLDTWFVEQRIQILQLLRTTLFYFMIISYLRAQQENVILRTQRTLHYPLLKPVGTKSKRIYFFCQKKKAY